MIRNWLALFIITTLTVALIFFWDSSPKDFLRNLQTDNKTEQKNLYPTNIIQQHSSQHYTEAGSLNHRFIADQVMHFQVNTKRSSSKDYTEATMPKITLYNENNPPWEITAKHARATLNGEIIVLTGDVKAWHTDTTGKRTELTTTKLVVKPNQQFAETDKAVMIKAPNNTTRAVGLEALLKQEKINLLSQVRGIYESP